MIEQLVRGFSIRISHVTMNTRSSQQHTERAIYRQKCCLDQAGDHLVPFCQVPGRNGQSFSCANTLSFPLLFAVFLGTLFLRKQCLPPFFSVKRLLLCQQQCCQSYTEIERFHFGGGSTSSSVQPSETSRPRFCLLGWQLSDVALFCWTNLKTEIYMYTGVYGKHRLWQAIHCKSIITPLISCGLQAPRPLGHYTLGL